MRLAIAKCNENWRFASFVLVGGVAAVVNIVSRVGLSLTMAYELAIVVAYIFGMTTAYALNRLFVFAASGRGIAHEYLRFTLVNFAAIIQVWVVSVGLARLVFPWLAFSWHSETIAHIIGVAIPVFTSYLGHKYFSFAPASHTDAKKAQATPRP